IRQLEGSYVVRKRWPACESVRARNDELSVRECRPVWGARQPLVCERGNLPSMRLDRLPTGGPGANCLRISGSGSLDEILCALPVVVETRSRRKLQRFLRVGIHTNLLSSPRLESAHIRLKEG